MRWEEIVEIEPELVELFNEARAVRDDKERDGFCANQVFYTQFKPRIAKLVGWGADNDAVATPAAYESAFEMIYRLLPPCRRCGCL